jgi:Domain of Unknown Function with PDB structure (DUF3857)
MLSRTYAFHLWLLGTLFFTSISFGQNVSFPKSGLYQNNLPLDTLKKYNMPNAIVLFEYTDLKINNIFDKNFYSVHKRFKIKLCNKKGYDAASISISYFSTQEIEEIIDLKATTINNEKGVISTYPVAAKDIYKSEETNAVTNISFTFPSLNDSSTLEYSYTIRRKSISYIPPVILQNKYPTLASYVLIEKDRFKTDATYNGIFPMTKAYAYYTGDVATVYATPNANSNRMLYTITGIQDMPDEPYMDGNAIDYFTRIAFTIVYVNGDNQAYKIPKDNWNRIALGLRNSDYFGDVLDKRINYDSVKTQINNLTDTLDKIKFIYQFVQKNYKFNKSISIYARKIDSFLVKKEGSRGDINLLLANMLRSFGLNTLPFVGKELKYGRIDMENPGYDQFSFVGALVTCRDTIYLLDASEKNSAYNMIPKALMTTDVLLINDAGGKWLYVWDGASNHKHYEAIEINIDSLGNATGKATLTSYGYERMERLNLWNKDPKKFEETYLVTKDKTFDNLTIKSTEDVDAQKKLVQKIEFSFKTNTDGKYLYFNANNIFPNFTDNPFTANKRITPINFKTCRLFNSTIKINIPASYMLNTNLSDGNLMSADTSMTYQKYITKNGSSIIIANDVQFGRALYLNKEYMIVREYYKNLINLFNESLVFVKKEN